MSGYVTTLGDALLSVAMVNPGGGFASPFYFILFTVTIASAMRYGYGPAAAVTLTFVGFDFVELSMRAPAWMDSSSFDPDS